MNEQWEKLVKLSLQKKRRLKQAAGQHGYNKTVEDATNKLEEIERSLQSQKVGNDLRSCKDLLKKHQILETELSQWERKVEDLITLGYEMAQDGHFDAPSILRTSQIMQSK